MMPASPPSQTAPLAGTDTRWPRPWSKTRPRRLRLRASSVGRGSCRRRGPGRRRRHAPRTRHPRDFRHSLGGPGARKGPPHSSRPCRCGVRWPGRRRAARLSCVKARVTRRPGSPVIWGPLSSTANRAGGARGRASPRAPRVPVDSRPSLASEAASGGVPAAASKGGAAGATLVRAEQSASRTTSRPWSSWPWASTYRSR